jgi:hypothetical protein
MANPATAKAFAQALDPSDVVDFYVVLSQGEHDAPVPTVLLLGEGVETYSLTLPAEAVAVGLRIVDRVGYEDRLVGNVLSLWLEVDSTMQTSPIFNGNGVTVPIEILIETTATPPRTKQRSFLVRISNQ